MTSPEPRGAGRHVAVAIVGGAALLVGALSLYFPAYLPLPLALPRLLALALIGIGPIALAGAIAGALTARHGESRLENGPVVPSMTPVADSGPTTEESEVTGATTTEEVPFSDSPTEATFELPDTESPPIPTRPSPGVGAAMAPEEMPSDRFLVPPPAEAPSGPLAFTPGIRLEGDSPEFLAPADAPTPTAAENEEVMEEEILRLRERVRELESSRPGGVGAVGPGSSARLAAPSVVAPFPSLLKLSQVPSPPPTLGRGNRASCSGCGALLGEPGHGHSCWGCARPLCAACFWKGTPDRAVHYCPGCVGRGVPEMTRSGGRAKPEGLSPNGRVGSPPVDDPGRTAVRSALRGP